HTRSKRDWSSDVCSSDLRGCPAPRRLAAGLGAGGGGGGVPPDAPATSRPRAGPLPAPAGALLRPGRAGGRSLPDAHRGAQDQSRAAARHGRADVSARDRPGGGRRTMNRPARRDLLRVAGAAAVLGVGAACARIPTDSPIARRELTGQSQPGAPYVRALPPPSDATAQEVVSGFVQAGVGPEDDYAVARSYLTPEASPDWDPSSLITIYSGSEELKVEDLGDDRFAMVLQVVALVDG